MAVLTFFLSLICQSFWHLYCFVVLHLHDFIAFVIGTWQVIDGRGHEILSANRLQKLTFLLFVFSHLHFCDVIVVTWLFRPMKLQNYTTVPLLFAWFFKIYFLIEIHIQRGNIELIPIFCPSNQNLSWISTPSFLICHASRYTTYQKEGGGGQNQDII